MYWRHQEDRVRKGLYLFCQIQQCHCHKKDIGYVIKFILLLVDELSFGNPGFVYPVCAPISKESGDMCASPWLGKRLAKIRFDSDFQSLSLVCLLSPSLEREVRYLPEPQKVCSPSHSKIYFLGLLSKESVMNVVEKHGFLLLYFVIYLAVPQRIGVFCCSD